LAAKRWCPRGYTLMGCVQQTLIAWKKEGKSFARPTGRVDEEFAEDLGSGDLPTVRINLIDGKMTPCPPEVWRVGGHLEAALCGEDVLADINSDEPYSTAIKTDDLAKWVGLSPELELPKAGSKRSSALPIPPGHLLKWWLDELLKEHPDPDKRPTVAAQYEAAKARFPNYAPPTVEQMQGLRAHPDTPSEWREAGRRPKSG
jgi:hypothetical protein